MASITKVKSTGVWTIAFTLGGRRRLIYLGKAPKRTAEKWRDHVSEIVAAILQNRAPDPETSKWVGSLDPSMHRKLVGKLRDDGTYAVGLVEPQEPVAQIACPMLDPFLDGYISRRTGDVKPATLITLGNVRRCLVGLFGPDKLLASITVADANDFRSWLGKPKNKKQPDAGGQGLSPNTVRRRCGIAKQFFADAVDRELIERNPFSKMRDLCVKANRDRDVFVTREDADKVIAACPDAEWKLIFALSRYGGLRCPSEHLALRWGDVDFERGRIDVRASKTEHHEAEACAAFLSSKSCVRICKRCWMSCLKTSTRKQNG